MNSLSRRALLRSLAAGAGGMALLPIMSRLTGASPQKVARFLFVVEGNSYYPLTVLDPSTMAEINKTARYKLSATGPAWWPDTYQHTTPIIVDNTQFDQTIALKSIASQGLSSQTAVVYGMSSLITGGGHTAMHGVLSSTRTASGSPGGQTIDAHLAALPAVRASTPYDAVRLGTVANGSPTRLSYATCAFGKGMAAAAIVDPVSAYNVLFGLVGSAAQMTGFNQRTTLLDFATQDVKAAVGAFGGSSDERAKLETYLASLEELSTRQQTLKAMAPQIAALNVVAPDQSPSYPNLATDCLDRFRAQLDLAAAAFQGQLTNVAVVTSGTGGDFGTMTYPGVPDPTWQDTQRHPLQHAFVLQGRKDAEQAVFDVTTIQLNHLAAVAHKLATTPDPADPGSMMLDNTVIVFISDNGEQHHSTASEFPVVLIGGQKLGLKTGGRTIVYPGLKAGSAHRQVSNLWNTMGYLAGEQLDTFGGEGAFRIAKGPLAELMS